MTREEDPIIGDIIGITMIEKETFQEIWDPYQEIEVNLEIVKKEIGQKEEDLGKEMVQEIGVGQTQSVEAVNAKNVWSWESWLKS